MKYFTGEWYSSRKPCKTSDEYYSYIENNYEYYPEWFKKYDVVNSGIFLFHDSLIEELWLHDNDIIISMVGIADSGNGKRDFYNESFELILKDAQTIELPDIVEGRDVIAEELYCSSDGTELHMLLTDDDIDYTMNLTLKCSEIQLKFETVPISFQLKMKFYDFINSFKKRNRIKNKAKKRR